MSKMLQRILPSTICRLGLATLIASAASWSVRAEDASAWINDSFSKMRLIAGANKAAPTTLRAGIELTLAPGWKTYWRYPGDSGIPPQFDFAGSENVKTVTVLWPAPERFSDGSGNSIGYHDHVIFPLRVVPVNAGWPATLRVNLRYAVCEKLCVPAQGLAHITLDGVTGAQDGALAAAEAWVPRPAQIGASDPLAVRAVHRDDSGARPRILVDVAAPPGAAVNLFAEGPTPDWALPLPEPRPGAPAGKREFAFALDGLPAKATAHGAELTLTLVGPAGAVEVKTRLD